MDCNFCITTRLIIAIGKDFALDFLGEIRIRFSTYLAGIEFFTESGIDAQVTCIYPNQASNIPHQYLLETLLLIHSLVNVKVSSIDLQKSSYMK